MNGQDDHIPQSRIPWIWREVVGEFIITRVHDNNWNFHFYCRSLQDTQTKGKGNISTLLETPSWKLDLSDRNHRDIKPVDDDTE